MFIFAKLLGGFPRTLAITGTTLRNGSLDAIFDKTPDCANTSTFPIGMRFFLVCRESTSACTKRLFEDFSFVDVNGLLPLPPILTLDVTEK